MIKIFDHFFLLRPMLFLPVFTFFFAGHWQGRRFGLEPGNGLYPAILPLCLVIGSIYILNQIQDRETDRINNKLFFLSEGHIPVSRAAVQAVLFAIAGLVWGFQVDFILGMLLLGQLVIGGLVYNYSPARWKDRPVGGLITNAVCGVFIFLTGFGAGSRVLLPVYALPYFFAGAAVYLNTTLPDTEGDRATGKRTFAVVYGMDVIAIWALVFEAGALITAFFLHDWLILSSALIALPFFIIAVINKREADIIRATKFSIFILVMAVCVFYPLLLLVIAALICFTKIYYRKRFHFDYPNFKAS